MEVKKELKRLFVLSVLAELFIFLFAFFSAEFDWSEAFKLAARYSGRLSLFFFTASFALTSKNWKNRRDSFKNTLVSLAKTFALLHLIHFFFLVMNVYLNEVPLVPYRLAGGGLAYVVLITYPWLLAKDNSILPKWFDNIYFYLIILMIILTLKSRLEGGGALNIVPSAAHYIGLTVTLISLLYHFLNLRKK